MNDIPFEALFNYATIGIITVDMTGAIVLANPYSLYQFGYKEEEVMGKKIEILIPDRFVAHHHELREKYTRKPKSRPMGMGLDLYGRRKDGTEFPVEVSLSNYINKSKTYMIAFVIDVSVRKENEHNLHEQQLEKERMARELRLLNEQLEQKIEDRTMMLRETLQQLERSRDELSTALEKEKELNDLKTRFVSMASHEFRTPLSTILSSVSLIDKYRLSEEQPKREKHIVRIKSQVRNLSNILEEFLSLGRLDEGLLEQKKELSNIREIMTDLISELYNMAKDKQTMVLHYTGPEMVLIDSNLLRNVLINLISNALKYSGEGTVVSISVIHTSGNLTISIRDKGIGISDEDLKHLTDRFFRGNNVINIQGTGLGLHIVKKYLDVMGGSIRFKSKLNEGTEVILSFNI